MPDFDVIYGDKTYRVHESAVEGVIGDVRRALGKGGDLVPIRQTDEGATSILVGPGTPLIIRPTLRS